MKRNHIPDAVVVLTTAPNRAAAKRMSQALLHRRLAACIHLAPRGESQYWWRGKLEKAKEIAMTLKTSKKALPSLVRVLKQIHPYDTPEILAISADGSHPAYARWLDTETRP